MANEDKVILLPKFDGSCDAEAWCRNVERVAKLKGWKNEDNEKNLILNIYGYLEKEARTWADAVKLDTVDTWEEAKKMLLLRFKPTMSSLSVVSALLLCKKKPKESFPAFGID